jgi:nucleotide-binding universal stress UspA family protein
MYKHILVPTDGTEFAARAVDHAVALAKLTGAKLTGVTVLPPLRVMAVEGAFLSETPEDYKRWVAEVAQERLEGLKAAAAAAGVTFETVFVENDQPFQGIISVAMDKNCDLIVMASHGRRGMSAVLLGSETQKVLTHSGIPVLVYR